MYYILCLFLSVLMTQHLMNLEFLEFFLHNSRPQTKFMFLQVSVIWFTGGGVRVWCGGRVWQGVCVARGMHGGGRVCGGERALQGFRGRGLNERAVHTSYWNTFLLF